MKVVSSLLGASAVALLALWTPHAGAQAELLPPGYPTWRSLQPVISITEQTFSLPPAEADQLMRELPTDALRHARLRELVTKGTAQLERFIVVRTMPGQRALAESTYIWRFASRFDLSEKSDVEPERAKKDPVVPLSFEGQDVGDTMELEPQIEEGGVYLTLNLVPKTVRYVGERPAGNHPAITQPIFETARTSTSVRVRDGQPYLVGTLSPKIAPMPGEKPREPRVWLNFVTANILWPEELSARYKGAAAMVARTQAMRVAELEFRDTPITEVVEVLRKKAQELDPNKKSLNIVLSNSKKWIPARITVSLKDVSLFDAARYVARLGALQVVPEESALIFLPWDERPEF